ncbi:hypothetical protein [Janthinobacterium kumbetense]|uniref:Uncharacterized protein n=1 Tax=Janthinobacterium kumbetense TaxID=2950280 RepID=A0ABT0WUZ3_9BURK|nr:hypothetical protein [Janthinobacterium kumbetense]MCM2567772.1 hypothetical protein [Janthinobacterium kumbetense]
MQLVACQLEAFIALHGTGHDGIRDTGVADPEMPVFEDNRLVMMGAVAGPVVNDLRCMRARHAVNTFTKNAERMVQGPSILL